MKLVKFFSDANEIDLQHEVNSFIREQQDLYLKEIVDIRYNTSVDEKGHDRWTAMVIYE